MDTALVMLTLFVFAGNFVEAVTGFGASIIVITFGAHFFPVATLVPVVIPLNLLLSVYVAGRYHRHVNRPELFRRILPFATVGIGVGFAMFAWSQGSGLKQIYGVFVVCLSVFQVVRLSRDDRALERPIAPWAAGLWLLGGGVMQGLFSSGGPLVVFCTTRTLPDKLSFRSTMSALWLALNTVLLISHIVLGTINRETLTLTGALLPPLVLGALAGDWVHHRVSQQSFRLAVYTLLAVAGATLIAAGK